MKLKPFIKFSFSLLLFNCNTDVVDDIVENETKQIEIAQRTTDYLDYGVYWFNSENESVKAYDENAGEPIEVSTSFYDDSKPTVVYFHGWQQDTAIDNYRRETFQFTDTDNGVNVNTVKEWKNRGWNVAIFYWNQFADEAEVKHAEAKIWSTNGTQKMRYRLSDGSYSENQSPSDPMGIVSFNQLSELLANNTSNNVRFVGHSLGNQLATYTAFLFSEALENGEISSKIMPDRLELLDPFWSKGAKPYLGDYNGDRSPDWTGERGRWYISEMIDRNNLAVTWYNSTLILNSGIGDSNQNLKDIVALQSVRFWYVSSIDIVDKHINARHNYFWSFSFDAPKEVTINWFNRRRETGNVAASASTSIGRIRSMMGDDHIWDQVEGRYTATPSDDMFEIK